MIDNTSRSDAKFVRVITSKTLTTSLAARRLGISEQTARQKIRIGSWPHVPGTSRPYLIPAAFIDSLLNPTSTK
jgi:hypothetical protein